MRQSRFKFLHAADIHLDSPLRGLERYEGAPSDEIRGATRQAFDNLVDLAIDEKVSFVLIAGDLYDGDWKDYNTGLYFVERMARLREAGIKVFGVTGNHDAASQITRVLKLPENVKFLSIHHPEKLVLDDVDVAIHGQGFATRAVTDDLAIRYPQGDPQLFNIGLLHTCLDGKPGHEPYAPCKVDELKSKGYQYWALGHVHKREEVNRDPWIVFSGNTQGRHIREIGPKGCSLVCVEDGEVTGVTHRDLDVLRWSRCTVDVAGSTSTDQIYELVLQALKHELDESDSRSIAVRLTLEGACPVHTELLAHRDHWMNQYRALATDLGGLWLEKVLLQTRRESLAEDMSYRDDALGGLLSAIRELEIDEAGLLGLATQLSELKTKLPHELLSVVDGYDPTSPQQIRNTLEEVKELLVNRLIATE